MNSTSSYSRLNAFGQPFRGSKIRGVQARRYMGGPSQGSLATRPRYNAREAAEEAVAQADFNSRQADRAAGMKRAEEEFQKKTQGQIMGPPAPKKREGMLVASAGGGYKWQTGEQLDAADAAKAEARKKMSYGEGGKNFVGPPKPRPRATFEGKYMNPWPVRSGDGSHLGTRLFTPGTATPR